GALYVVALPLGNAADITLRALWILARVDVIAAEDTRVTRPLLERFGIHVPLLAAHRHNERASAQAIEARLDAGERVALVTDAGTPAVSDPGALIVRAALAAGRRVVPVPGASSAVAAVSVAGLAAHEFQFIGFLPTGVQQRKRMLADLAAQPMPFVLYEAPHRVRALLDLLASALTPTRRIVIARELTKKFEQVSVHRADDLAAFAVQERGEFVIVVDAAEAVSSSAVDPQTRRWLDALAVELPAARAAAVVAKVSGANRHELYEILKQRDA
ncbi:MAG: 16S rRNA (cytidine(1402)-2'-O)-methyltransferase, partial [Burkholderiaceae bacterium]